MINEQKLLFAFKNKDFYTLQIEAGASYLPGCTCCTVPPVSAKKQLIQEEQIINVLSEAHMINISVIEWIGGEPLSLPGILNLLSFAASLGLKNNIWTTGLPLVNESFMNKLLPLLKDGMLTVHIPTLAPQKFTKFYPDFKNISLENMKNMISAVLDFGYPPNQILNYINLSSQHTFEDLIKTLDFFKQLEIKTFLYFEPSLTNDFLDAGKILNLADKNYEKFIKKYKTLWSVTDEKLLNANRVYCTSTLALTGEGTITPCISIRKRTAPTIYQNESFSSLVNKNRVWLLQGKYRNPKFNHLTCRYCKFANIYCQHVFDPAQLV